MSNSDHVNILMQGVHVWNRWRKSNPDVTPDLSRLRLPVDVTESSPLWDDSRRWIDLTGVDLTDANMETVHMKDVWLTDAVLDGANCRHVRMENVQFQGASLTRVSFTGAFLLSVNLRDCRLTDAVMTEVWIERSDMERAELDRANLVGARFTRVDLNGAQLQRTQWNQAQVEASDFSRGDLKGADLRGAAFQNVKMIGACVEEADLERTIFRNAVLMGIDGRNANCTGACLAAADLKGARLTGSDLTSCDIRSADLRWVDLRDANTARVKFNRCARYRGIRLDGCYSSPAFVRYAKDQEFIEEVRETSGGLGYWFVYLPWLISSDCGRSILLWAGWSVILAFGFAVQFHSMGLDHFDVRGHPSHNIDGRLLGHGGGHHRICDVGGVDRHFFKQARPAGGVIAALQTLEKPSPAREMALSRVQRIGDPSGFSQDTSAGNEPENT